MMLKKLSRARLGAWALGLLLGLLGLVAGIAGARGGLRLDFRRTGNGTDRPHRAAAATALAIATALVVVVVVVHRAWLQSFWHQGPGLLSEQIAVQTWLPSGQVAAIQVVVAALAGAGIGLCRPLGTASSWLLLPFLPWLFVGEGPLLVAHLTATYDPELGAVDSPWYPPVWVNVALMVLFTLLAGAGHWLLGSIDWWMLLSLLCGSLPGIALGSLLSARAPDKLLRHLLAATLTLVGARLVGA